MDPRDLRRVQFCRTLCSQLSMMWLLVVGLMAFELVFAFAEALAFALAFAFAEVLVFALASGLLVELVFE